MRNIKLLSIVTRMNVGGPAVQISTLMRSFAGTRVYQVLLTGQVGPDEEDYLKLNGSDLRYVSIAGLQREVSLKRDTEALARIAYFMKRFNPDIVHTHTAKAGTLGRTAAVLTRSRAKRVHTFHGHLLHGYFTPKRTRQVVRIERTLARRTDRLIAVGRNVRDDLLAEGIGSIDQYRIVPPGLALSSVPERVSARHELSLPESAFVICFVGRLTEIKRIDRLVAAAAILSRIHPEVIFLIAGDGSEMPLISEASLRDGLPIRTLGWRSDVERILGASDAMVLTSDNEGTPVSLIQAGLAGVPVVSTRVGSVGDVVVDGKSGILTSTDSGEIAQALEKLITDAHFRHELGDFAKRNYNERFGSHVLVQGHLEIYDELLSE